MSVMWIFFASLVLYQFGHHEAGMTGNQPRILPKKPLYKQREVDALLKISSGRGAKEDREYVDCSDCVSQEEFDKAISALQSSIDKLQIDTIQLKEEQQEQLTRIEKLENANKPIGFTAYMTQGKDLQVNSIVPFDRADNNVGNGFDGSTHKFTCPVTGLYLFSVSTFSDRSYSMLQLVKNGNSIVAAFGDYTVWDQGSIIWVVECNQGDEVWCQAIKYVAKLGYHGHGVKMNSFSGVLITPQV